MGGTSARSWRKVLHEALDGYQEQEARGGDMAEAGAEFARAVERLLIPPPCSPPRDGLLRDTAPLTDYGAEQASVPLDDQ